MPEYANKLHVSAHVSYTVIHGPLSALGAVQAASWSDDKAWEGLQCLTKECAQAMGHRGK